MPQLRPSGAGDETDDRRGDAWQRRHVVRDRGIGQRRQKHRTRRVPVQPRELEARRAEQPARRDADVGGLRLRREPAGLRVESDQHADASEEPRQRKSEARQNATQHAAHGALRLGRPRIT